LSRFASCPFSAYNKGKKKELESMKKKSDKILYGIMLTMGILTVVILTYFIVFILMESINSSEGAKLLIDIHLYQLFYQILNAISSVAIFVLLTVIFLAIPYAILSLILCILYSIKYVKYKGKKKKQIIQTTILGMAIAFLVFEGITSVPLTSQYEIEVRAKVSDVTNIEVKKFLEEELKENPYVDKIEIRQGFPDDYVVRIHYRNITKKVKNTSLTDSDYSFIQNHAKDITKLLEIKAISMTLIGEILYLYFLGYILKEFKRICEE